LRYNEWYKAITSDGNLLRQTSDSFKGAFTTRQPEDKKVFESLALAYAKKNARCPFLINDLCTIYPIRPYTCSTYAVITDKVYCEPDLSENEYLENKIKIKSAMNPLYFEEKYCDLEYYSDMEGRYSFGPMQQMVYHILRLGPDLSGSSDNFKGIEDDHLK
jgi:Fe-S-cluster containining protein